MINNFKSGFTPRKEQITIVNAADDTFNVKNKKFLIASAPTGVGKSLIASCLANSSPDPHKDWVKLVSSYEVYKKIPDGPYPGADFFETHEKYGATVLTITKSLQDQYTKDFAEASSAKGKSSTPCAIDSNFACDFSYCSLNSKQLYKCWDEKCCTYYEEQNNAILSKFGVLNYSKYLAMPEHLKYKKFLICDECSEIEKTLVNQYTIEFAYKNLDKLDISYEYFRSNTNNDILYDKDKNYAYAWLSSISVKLDDKYKELTQVNDINKIDSKRQLQIRIIKRVMENIYNLMQVFNSTQYIVEFSVEKVKFIPYKVDVLAQNLFNYCDHVLLMSATIVDVKNFAKVLGIKEQDYEYVEVDSPFDSSKSPIVTFKDFPLNNKNLEDYMPKIVKLVNQILQTHHDEKGIIHTHTMKITNAIAQGCNYDDRLIVRNETANNEKIVAEHKTRKDASVLVSPSLTFGTNLPGDLGRFTIIIKAAYPSLGDTRIKKLFDVDKEWYQNQMLTETIQATGRTTRSEDDYSVTYIIDTNVVSTVIRNRHKLPKHFLDRFQ